MTAGGPAEPVPELGVAGCAPGIGMAIGGEGRGVGESEGGESIASSGFMAALLVFSAAGCGRLARPALQRLDAADAEAEGEGERMEETLLWPLCESPGPPGGRGVDDLNKSKRCSNAKHRIQHKGTVCWRRCLVPASSEWATASANPCASDRRTPAWHTPATNKTTPTEREADAEANTQTQTGDGEKEDEAAEPAPCASRNAGCSTGEWLPNTRK